MQRLKKHTGIAIVISTIVAVNIFGFFIGNVLAHFNMWIYFSKYLNNVVILNNII